MSRIATSQTSVRRFRRLSQYRSTIKRQKNILWCSVYEANATVKETIAFVKLFQLRNNNMFIYKINVTGGHCGRNVCVCATYL